MAILTMQESIELLKATANNVMADGSVSMYPLHGRAILDVIAAFEKLQQHNTTLAGLVADAEQREFNVTAERDALRSQVSTLRDSRDDMEERYFGALIDGAVQP